VFGGDKRELITKSDRIREEWLVKHPCSHLRFTPTSSCWLNLIERGFAELANRKLRRSAHRSLPELDADIR
jgi:hypothetical protein